MKRNVKQTVLWRIAVCLIAGTLLFGACETPTGDPPQQPVPEPDFINELTAKIDAASRQLEAYSVSEDGLEVFQHEYWLNQNEWDTLNDSIEAAKLLLNPLSATPEQRQQAMAVLDIALETAFTARRPGNHTVNVLELAEKISTVTFMMTGIQTSENGFDLLPRDKWITPAAHTALTGTLEAAEAVLRDKASTQEQVDQAAAALDLAYTTHYHPQPGTSVVDKTQLNGKIREVKQAAAGVVSSADGTDVLPVTQWVTAEVYSAIHNALGAAEQTAADKEASASEVNTALTSLNTAFANFHPQSGTKTPSPNFASAQTVNGPEDEFTYDIELTFDYAVSAGGGDAKNGFTIAVDGSPAVVESAVISGDSPKITFTLREDYPVQAGMSVQISYAPGSMVAAADNTTPALAFGPGSVTNRLAALENPVHPWLTKAEVVTASPSTIQLTFSEPVHIDDESNFVVKVNDEPAVRIANYDSNNRPQLDLSKKTDRSISGASPTASGKKYDTVWTLSVSDAAKHGEILRLAANALDAYVDRGGNGLPPPATDPPGQQVLSQFIIRNLVPRNVTSPTAAGFYKNGAAVDGFNPSAGNQLYKEAIAWLTTGNGTNVTDEDVFTIVLGEDQTYPVATTFTAAQAPVTTTVPASGVRYPSKSFTIVLASTGGEKVITVTGSAANAAASATTAGLVIRNGITLIIESGVAFEHANQGETSGTSSGCPLIIVADGGKLILDGGEIRKNYSAVGTAGAGLPNSGNCPSAGGVFLYPNDITTEEAKNAGEAYFIMNGGKITGNTMDGNERGISAGGIAMLRNSFFVMHSGEVSNNTLNHNGTNTGGVSMNRAGGIAGFGAPNGDSVLQNTNRCGIYITGGSVTGNKLEGTGTAVLGVSAGGIILSGTFQKTGGTISGNTNTLTSTVSSAFRTNGIIVWRGNGVSIPGTNEGHLLYRGADADTNVMLFAEGFRTKDPDQDNRIFGFTAKSPFVPSYGTAPNFSPNGWEN